MSQGRRLKKPISFKKNNCQKYLFFHKKSVYLQLKSLFNYICRITNIKKIYYENKTI